MGSYKEPKKLIQEYLDEKAKSDELFEKMYKNTMKRKARLAIRTRPIGYVFQQGGRSYEVVEVDQSNGCRGCGMNIGTIDEPCIADIEACGLCYKSMRSDNKSVIFKKIEHEEA